MAEQKTQKPEETRDEKAVSTNLQAEQAARFTNAVMAAFSSNTGAMLELSEYQKRIVSGYFIGTNRALKTAEENRLYKNGVNKDHGYDNLIPYDWNHVDLDSYALDVVHYARMGLDMLQKNHISPVMYADKKNKRYSITLMEGYSGIQYIAEKYALEVPLDVTTELVYSTDVFKPIKKSATNGVESYEFEIKNAFSRGEIVGGFGYIQFADPRKNKLVMMTLADIQKRKPKYAAAEFWGGEKEVWKDGKKITEQIEGWFPEMCLKTLKREIYGDKNIPRDPMKIDDDYQYMKKREAEFARMETQAEIDENMGKEVIEAEFMEMNPDTGEVIEPGTTPAQ
jgi:recombination protein RecT